MTEQFYYRTFGQEFGPITRSTISEMIRQKLLVPGDSFRVMTGPWSDIARFAGHTPSTSPGVVATVSPEEAPWAYLSSTGIVGPLTTGQLLESIRGGRIQRGTMIRLLLSPEWIAAEQIEGLAFPQSGVHEAPAASQPGVHELTHTPASQEMRHLFAECLSRQKTSQAAHPARVTRRESTRNGSRWLESVSSLGGQLVDGVMSLMIFIVRSRVAWVVAGLLLVGLGYLRFGRYLTTHGQVYSTLQNTYEEMVQLRNRPMDEVEWREFQNRASQNLSRLVPLLEWRASIEDKKSMSLLWLARDYLPTALEQPLESGFTNEGQIEEHLAIVRNELSQSSNSTGIHDPWTQALIGLDVIGVVGAVIYFRRRR